MNTFRYTFAFLSIASLLFGGTGFAGDAPGEEDPPTEKTCFSIQPHVSDAWCQAVDCDPTYADFCSTGEEEPAPESPPPAESVTAECVSAAPHISDAWCAAVECAPVFVEAGLCSVE